LLLSLFHLHFFFFFLMILRPPCSTLFPYTTLFRSFYSDLKNQGLLDDTLLLTFSEFGRRISENGSAGTDLGAASVMMVMGGKVKDRKSTRLNSSHVAISYAVFCLKKKKKNTT